MPTCLPMIVAGFLLVQPQIAKGEFASLTMIDLPSIARRFVEIAAKKGPDGVKDQAAVGADAEVYARLVVLREKMTAFYNAGDKAGLDRLKGDFSRIAKQKDYDLSCRLIATGSERQIKYYVKALDADTADMKKIALGGVAMAEVSIKGNLEDCG
ncbi:hypothetical protein [uncultured Agrobacterium sp.]|uniref:hypothetical protein n=1 Tax=uncultured Agrobacterium sp. TaxID=157277 RepID=UPI0025F3A550|nr:hypothetical protein [uncultured Agrobacterium sp.]